MLEIGAFEAKNRLAALLDAVERGEEVTITRRGKPVAKLVRHESAIDRSKAREAAEQLRAMRKGVTLGGMTIQELIEESRR